MLYEVITLLSKEGDNTSITSEYVSESNHGKLGLPLVIQALNKLLRYTLCRPHHTCRIDGFVR